MKVFSPSIASVKRLLFGSARELGLVALLIASVATVVAIFVIEENWRGDRAWAAYEHGIKTKGESVDLATFATPPVPDQLNFFKAPLIERILLGRDAADRQKLIEEYTLGSYFPKRLPPDFSEVRDMFKRRGLFSGPESDAPATDVLAAMRRFDPLFEALRDAALHRPQASLNGGGSLVILPDGEFSGKAARALTLHAYAALAVGDTATAYLDTFTLLRFSQSLTGQPGPVIMMALANSLKTLAAGIIKEGCARRIWNDSQLAELQSLLTVSDPLGSYVQALRVERAGFLYFLNAEPRPPEIDRLFPFWLFHGWVQQNKIRFSKIYDAEILPAFAEGPDRNLSERLQKLQETTKRIRKSSTPYDRLARGALINFGSLGESYIGTTTQVLHAATLCALERYRLAKGSWPEKLENLVPAYLPAIPKGIFTGDPVKYELLPEGGFRLEAAGPEGQFVFAARDGR